MSTSLGDGFRGPDGRLGYLLRQAQHSLWIALESALSPLGITAAQFGVLRLIEVEPGASGVDLAHDSLYSPQSTQEMLVSLEAAGLVERRPDPDDRRRRQAYVTQTGADTLVHAHRLAEGLEERMVAQLSETERLHFRTWLVEAAQAIDTTRESAHPLRRHG
jgi:DNA-binding MarR family transcriptional regulator